MKTLWNNYEFTICFAISVEIHHLFREFTICFAKFLWIYNRLRGFSLKSLSISWIHLQYIILFAKPLKIRSGFTMKPFWHHYDVTIFFALSLGIHHREFTTCFPNYPWIYYLPGDFSWNSLSFWRIHALLREFILNPLSFFWNEYEFAMKSLWN